MEFDNLEGLESHGILDHGKSWNFMLANLYAAELPTVLDCLTCTRGLNYGGIRDRAIPYSETVLSPLTSIVRGRWQHISYRDSLFSANQSLTALYGSVSFVHSSATRGNLLKFKIDCAVILSARDLKVRGVLCALRFVHVVDFSTWRTRLTLSVLTAVPVFGTV